MGTGMEEATGVIAAVTASITDATIDLVAGAAVATEDTVRMVQDGTDTKIVSAFP
jgi:hypothetical protein